MASFDESEIAYLAVRVRHLDRCEDAGSPTPSEGHALLRSYCAIRSASVRAIVRQLVGRLAQDEDCAQDIAPRPT